MTTEVDCKHEDLDVRVEVKPLGQNYVLRAGPVVCKDCGRVIQFVLGKKKYGLTASIPMRVSGNTLENFQREQEGVGANLKERWKSYGMPPCKFCNNLAADMNKWGPVGCRVRFDEIVNRIVEHTGLWAEEVEKETGKKVHFIHKVLAKSPDFLKRHKIKADVEWAIATEEGRAQKKE